MMQTNQDKLRALRKIRQVALMALGGTASPAMMPAIIGVALGGLIGCGLAHAVQAGWLIVVGGLMGGFVGFRVAKYKTWDEYIYVLLAAYDPEDKAAYASLQKQAADRSLCFSDVKDWAAGEKERLTPSPPSKADQARDAFVAKPLR